MLGIALAMAICMATMAVLRPRAALAGPVVLVGFDGAGVLIIFMVYVAATALLGAAFALSLLAGFALHEAGHVLANRMLGRGVSQFRLVPAFTPCPVPATPFRGEGEAFFVALMGAGFSLAPMALALALAPALGGVAPQLADFLVVLGATLGALNFVMLLPFRPFDGGRCAEIAARNFWPALAPGLAAFMIAALIGAGLRSGSLALLVLAAFGLHSLLPARRSQLRPMGAHAALIALAAYAMTLAAHFTAGWLLFSLFL